MTRWRPLLGLTLLTLVALVASLTVTVQPIYASNNFNNAFIADKGLEEVGTSRATGWNQPGECIKSVQRWVAAAGGSFVGGGVVSGYVDSGAQEVSLSTAVKGDVIQYTNADGANDDWTHVHTVVVVKNHGNGRFDIVQSNVPEGSGLVTAPTNWSPSPAAGWVARVWRFGKAMGDTGSGGVGSDGLYHGTPPDGMIVENVEGGHLYVAAGGALFWFDRNNSYLWESFLTQRRRLLGEIPVPRMSATEVHALEANYPSPRHRVPRDNTYLYEIGNSQQHVVMYGYGFPVGVGDLDFLGGRDRAVMIPANNIHHFVGTPSIPNDVLLKDHLRPEVYHVVWNTLHHANNDTVVDCIKKVKGGALQPVPVSLMDRLFQAGRFTGSITGCTFPGHWAIHGPGGAERWHISGNNPYSRYRYADPLSLHCRLGSNPTGVEISTSGVNSPPEGAPLGCPNGTVVRIRGNGEVFQIVDGVLHYVPWPDMVGCLTAGHPEAVIDIEGPVVATTPRGSWAVCSYEGRQIMAPNGWVYYVKNGQKQHVPHPAVRDCLMGRSGTGNPVAVPWETLNSYVQAPRTAYCPYGVGANFVKEANSPTVWRITADGTRQHANGFCVVDPWTTALLKFRVWVVPDGEVAGHTWDGSVFAVSGESCNALPS